MRKLNCKRIKTTFKNKDGKSQPEAARKFNCRYTSMHVLTLYIFISIEKIEN